MDYEKKYNEALERARRIKNGEGDWRYSDLIEIGPALIEIFTGLAESEDERIRKELIEFLKEAYSRGKAPEECAKWLAYLEKQKERGRNITANLLEDGITGVQRELIEFLANNINASWVDVIKSADAYAQRIRSMVEKQKEQKPSPKFRVGDMMRTKQEAAEEINDGIPVVVSIDEDYYICNNEKIPITDQ